MEDGTEMFEPVVERLFDDTVIMSEESLSEASGDVVVAKHSPMKRRKMKAAGSRPTPVTDEEDQLLDEAMAVPDAEVVALLMQMRGVPTRAGASRCTCSLSATAALHLPANVWNANTWPFSH